MPQRTEQLLASVDRLSYPQRMRRLAEEARRARDEGHLDELLEGLSTHGTHGRRTAAHIAGVAQDDAYLEGCLADADHLVRAPAVTALRKGRLADDAVTAALDDAPAVARQQILRAIAVGQRTALAEALVEPLAERWGAEEAAGLLAACVQDTVVRLLPRLFRGLDGYRLLARRHPGPLLAEVERQLDQLAPDVREGWLASHGDALAALVEPEPLGVLAVLERYETLPWPVYGQLNRLVEAAPGRTVRLLLRPRLRPKLGGSGLDAAVLHRLVRRDPPELADLARAWSDNPTALARLLACLPPSRRAALFDTATDSQDLSRAALAPVLLDVLPHERRIVEARRMAAQARERDAHWSEVLAAVTYLPPEEARDELLAAVRRPDAEERAQAYPFLVRNAARFRDPQAVGGMLRDLLRLRNEQEPVRAAALSALAHVHPSLFTEDDADVLTRIATDAVEARDSSWDVRRSLGALALAVLREHAVTGRTALIAWSLDTVTALSGQTGGVNLGRLDTTLRRGQEHEVVAALRPWLEAGADKVDHTLTFALVRALGRRAWRMPELQEYLWQAVQYGSDTTVRTAITLWLEQPRGRDEKVARILELEPSAAVLPPVLDVLVKRRTDLLDPVLADTPPYGRFLTARSHWTPPVNGAHRWVPRQQRAAAALLARTAGNAGHAAHIRAAAIWEAAPIPDAGLDVVRRYLASANVPLAEAALGALVWTDEPAQTLPLLLEHAGGDRARVAVYAAARAARYAAPSRLGARLRALLVPDDERGAKVTSRKEAVRLAAARLPAAEAAGLLREACELPGQHPDVRTACVATARLLLHRPEAWSVLGAAAAGTREMRQALARTAVYEVDEEHRPRYAALMRAACTPPDAETAQALYPALAQWAPWDAGIAGVLVDRVTDLDDRSAWDLAARALVGLSATDAHPLAEALRTLLTAAADPAQPDAEPDRDLPARQRVAALVSRLDAHARYRRAQLRPAQLRAAGVLAGYEGFEDEVVTLRLQALDLEADAPALVSELRELTARCADRPLLADRAASRLAGLLGDAGRPGRTEELLTVARSLAAEPGLPEGMFAVTLVAVGGARTLWTEPWRTALRAVRRHPHPDVRAAARVVTTARET
ncbi:hypothetical protein AB0M28_08680 [Streptomyces sp. NPDC051940]|uniref:hypothetical protein n=1 Tax=Streptomyces sp. NPDC051940 TaxID=3155675 RepID=UPI003441B7E2